MKLVYSPPSPFARKIRIVAMELGLPDEIAEKTAREWETYPGFADAHLRELRAILDAEDPSYAD